MGTAINSRFGMKVVGVLVFLLGVFAQNETAVDPCVFEVAGTKYDLTALQKSIGSAGKTATQVDTISYQFGVCGPVTAPRTCTPTTTNCIVYQDNKGAACYCLGLLDQAQAPTVANGALTLTFTGGYQQRQISLVLTCGPESQPTGGEPNPLKYQISWSTKGSCPPSPGGSSGAMTGIEIFILAAFVSLIAYCLIGSVYLWRFQNRTGTEIIPNKSFWTDLPFLVKDGIMFTFGGIKVCLFRATGRTEISGSSGGGSTVKAADV
eukprot:c10948_g1_i2.p1 GENE.c10948_g1_i2~~c10948_g1_i2.p1  ORF type:complete len:264 (+),score=36.92 c10948_g1_i2:1-792(+)